MARFKVQSSGYSMEEVTRSGDKDSGIWTHIHGIDAGVEVYGFVDGNGKDCFQIYKTDGVNCGDLITTVKGK